MYLMFFVKIDNYALNLLLYNQKIIRTSENLISVWLQYWPSLTILLIKILELRQLMSNWQYNFHLIILKEILNLSAYLFNCTCKYDVINSKKKIHYCLWHAMTTNSVQNQKFEGKKGTEQTRTFQKIRCRIRCHGGVSKKQINV